MLPEALALCVIAATGPSPDFTCFAGQRPRAQRSAAADLIFGSFHQGKELSLSGD